MKFYILSMLLLLTGIANATNYYVDASTTATVQNGGATTPWKTLNQVNSNMSLFNPGDVISFKKGLTYTGQLTVNRSGAAGSPITFNSYGTGAAPVFSGTGSRINNVIYVFNRNYLVFDGLNITDPSLSPTDRTVQCNIERAFYIDGTSNNVIIRNCSISLVGIGVFFAAGNNTLDNCNIQNLRMVVNTNNGGYDDYGANPVVISSSNNTITNNRFQDCWANSYDFTYDGGAIEFYGANTNNNFVGYNTMINNNGLVEFGSGSGGVSDGNTFAYNKMINNGGIFFINNSGNFAITVTNLRFYNNVVVETVVQRLYDNWMMSMSTASSLASIGILKNNIFWLTTGIDVARSGQFTGTQLVHEDNIYRLGTGSVLNFTASPTELTTTASNLFSNVTASDPAQWDFLPPSNSPAIDFGQNVGIARDFAGNPVPSVPNAGILEATGIIVAPPTVSASAGTISCNGGTTTVTVSATGGAAPYNGTGTFTVTAGTYNYTVTDANGSTATTSVTVAQPSSLTSTVTPGTINTNGGTTSITVSASGGTAPYTYQLNTGNFQTASNFTAVTAGLYTINVKDARGCLTNRTVTITQPGKASMNVTASAGTIACNGGSANVTVSASGGTAPYTGTGTFNVTAGTYTYSVMDATYGVKSTSITVSQPTAVAATVSTGTINVFGGTTTATVSASGGSTPYTYKLNNGNYQSSANFSGIAAGSHTITIKDNKGCLLTKNITLTQPANTSLSISASAGTILCNGGTTTVTVTATAGTPPYTGTGTFTRSAGTHSFSVTDAGGVTRTTSVTISQPSAISISLSAGTITAYGGLTSITATVSGGTAPYQYKKNSGSYQTSNVFGNITAGSHTITVQDARGCTVSTNINITQPASSPLQASASATSISCNGGTSTITVSATGGAAPYTGTGTFTRTAGTYTFSVSDANGATKNVTITVAQPQAITVTATSGTITVAGGTTTVTASATGGFSPYTYKLDNGAYQSSGSFTGVTGGAHTVTVKDSKGCTSVKSINIQAPVQIVLVSKTNNTCRDRWDGTITVSATGGTAPYLFQIDNWGYGSTATFINLGPNTYTLKAKDATGAVSTMSVTILASNIRCTNRSNSSEELPITVIPEPSKEISIKAYPNPTSSVFQLDLQNNTANTDIMIFDARGVIVERIQKKGLQKITLGQSLSAGVYFVKITAGEIQRTIRIIKTTN
jgi:hypothetical protein